jgi:hypothetical protein
VQQQMKVQLMKLQQLEQLKMKQQSPEHQQQLLLSSQQYGKVMTVLGHDSTEG